MVKTKNTMVTKLLKAEANLTEVKKVAKKLLKVFEEIGKDKTYMFNNQNGEDINGNLKLNSLEKLKIITVTHSDDYSMVKEIATTGIKKYMDGIKEWAPRDALSYINFLSKEINNILKNTEKESPEVYKKYFERKSNKNKQKIIIHS